MPYTWGLFPKIESLFELPPEVAAAPFGEEGVLAVQLHAGLVGVGLLALAVDPQVAGGDALHRGASI